MLNVPFAIADATALTEAGYVGEDVENILLKLIQAADFDVKKAETGIIYIDEIDKVARKSENRFAKTYRVAMRSLFTLDDFKTLLKTREVYSCMVAAAGKIDVVGEKLVHVIVKIS